jgi:HAD superfamily hydrolase (TIGR01490 family)
MADVRGSERRRSTGWLAVFDIDGTIFRSSLLIECVQAMISAGLFPEEARKLYEGMHRKWLDRKGTYEKYIAAVVQAFRRHIPGIREVDFVPIVRQMFRAQRHRVYRYARDLVARLRRRGYYLIPVSHSPRYMVDDFARELGFDKIYGRVLGVTNDGRFTGRARHLSIISDKAKVLRRVIEKQGLTLVGSVGVGDSEADVGFLEMVEIPICFNPNAALLRVAKRRAWKVAVERKDVVYEIRPER